jgi:hypothetical protein
LFFSVEAFLIGGRDMSSSRFSLDTIGLFGLTCDVRGQPETTPSAEPIHYYDMYCLLHYREKIAERDRGALP